jgi:hypothetical protein
MIVGIHGVGYQRVNVPVEQEKWRAALRVGSDAANVDTQLANNLRFVGYGDLFIPRGTLAGADPPYDAADVEEGLEYELLVQWFREAQRVDSYVPGSQESVRLPHVPRSVQQMLNALSYSRTFASFSERALIFNLKQVRRYLSESSTRAAIQARVANAITADTRLVIAHSLGTVVAYEALCAHPEWGIRGLITMGSPLGIRNLIFDRLVPSPSEGFGCWPSVLEWWVNVADGGDIVAIEKRLSSRFGYKVEDWLVDNGIVEVHGAEKYLAQAAVGAALRRLDLYT